MDAFVSRKRRWESPMVEDALSPESISRSKEDEAGDDESTEYKLAILASLHPNHEPNALLETLLLSEGSIEAASESLNQNNDTQSTKKKRATTKGSGYQSSLAAFSLKASTSSSQSKKLLTRKGTTLHLYSPEDIETHTPCSIIHNFLPNEEADALLHELLEEAPTFQRETFKLFDKVVQSPHTMCFYVDSLDEARKQKTEYVYNGSYIKVGKTPCQCL